MLTTPEPPMISQNIASTTLLDIVVSPHLNKLPNQLLMDLNIRVLVRLLTIQLIIWLLKFQVELLHYLTSTHGQGTTLRLPILMLTTQEHPMISQNIASTTLQDIAVSPHQSKLPSQLLMDHNIKILVRQLTIQLTTWLFRLRLLHYPTSTHGQGTILRLLILMPTIQEHQMIFQNIASTTLQDIAVSPHQSKLPSQLLMDHNIKILVRQLTIQLTTWLFKLRWKVDQTLVEHQEEDTLCQFTVDLRDLISTPLSTAQISTREWLSWMEKQKLYHIHNQDSIAMLITVCE